LPVPRRLQQRHDREAVGVVSVFDALHAQEALNQQPCSGQQDDGASDFRDDQRLLKPVLALGLRAAAHALQRAGDGHVEHPPRGDDREHDAGDNRNRRGEQQHHAVDMHLFTQRDECGPAGIREEAE
jgi:hypothetical protein